MDKTKIRRPMAKPETAPSTTRLDDPMAVHEPHPGRKSRSVSFDDGKRRVIPTDLDPEVDPEKLKTVVGRPPTPRPSSGDLTVTPPDEHGESSRPPKRRLEDQPVGAQGRVSALNPEVLMMRLTLECAGEAVKEGAADESALAARRRRRHGRGRPRRRQAVGRGRADQRGRSDQRGRGQLRHRVARQEGSRATRGPPTPRPRGVNSGATRSWTETSGSRRHPDVSQSASQAVAEGCLRSTERSMAIGSSCPTFHRRNRHWPHTQTASSTTRLDDPMAVHEPHPGRRSRSVSFDDGKRRVITTELDPEVDPVKLKTVVGRRPTPRPSRTDVSVTTPEENGESSRPPSAGSQTSPPAHMDGPALNPELLTMRLTLECAGEAAKERASDESAPRREGGEGMNGDARAAAKLLAADELTSDGGLTSEGGDNAGVSAIEERIYFDKMGPRLDPIDDGDPEVPTSCETPVKSPGLLDEGGLPR
ncbi:hypothetical protein MTO96_027294 [Rhipicephalus appendiculatus]